MSQPSTTEQPGLQYLPLAKIKPASDNVRANVGDVAELAASIKAHGLIEPLVVVQRNGHFEIVAGARRLAGAKLAKLAKVPVIVREFSDAERIQVMLIENLQREDLKPLEEAKAYRRLVDECGMTQRDLASKTGVSQGHVSKRLALLDLPDDIAVLIDSGGITVSDAVELARLKGHPEHLKNAAFGPSYYSIPQRVEHELERVKVDQKIAKREEELESQAIPTIRVDGKWNLPKGVFRLKGGGYDYQALQIDAAKHASEGCHAIAITNNLDEFPVCTDRKNHPKIKTLEEKNRTASSRGDTPATRQDRELKERELDAAALRRTAFAGELVARNKTFGKPALTRLLVDGYIDRAIEIGEENVTFACVALGLAAVGEEGALDHSTDVLGLLRGYQQRGETEALRLAAILMLGEVEAYDLSAWHAWGQKAADYLALLEQHGYEISDVERKQLTPAAS